MNTTTDSIESRRNGRFGRYDKKMNEPSYRVFLLIVGKNIRRYRRLRGLTQEDLAKIVFGTRSSRSYVCKIEKGTARISLATIDDLANALGVRPWDLFDDTILYYYESEVAAICRGCGYC